MIRNSKLLVGLALVLFMPMPSARAQQTSIDDLKKEIQNLNNAVKGMQKDLEEIKSLLKPTPRPAPVQNVLLDLDDSPAKGERSAKLTLIEFSDYQ